MKSLLEGKYLHTFFLIGIYIKAVDGIAEVLAGIILLFPKVLTNVIHILITTKPLGSITLIANHKEAVLSFISGKNGLFIVIYILTHGVLKLLLVVRLLKHKLWAYPSAIIIFAAFIIYQIYRYVYAPSSFLIFLTVLDFIVIGLTWREYSLQKSGKIFFRL